MSGQGYVSGWVQSQAKARYRSGQARYRDMYRVRAGLGTEAGKVLHHSVPRPPYPPVYPPHHPGYPPTRVHPPWPHWLPSRQLSVPVYHAHSGDLSECFRVDRVVHLTQSLTPNCWLREQRHALWPLFWTLMAIIDCSWTLNR